MTTKVCNRCFRDLPIALFHANAAGRIRGKCKQCAAGDCARRRARAKAELNGRPPPKPADPMNLVLRDWRGPVNQGALKWAM